MTNRISFIFSIAALSLTLMACSEESPLSSIPDCAGIVGGTAVIDECGVCNGDNTQCADCNGVPYGDGLADNCDVCDNDSTNDCVEDCAGTWGGTSTLDDCGVCDGDNTTCADCAGVPNGDSTLDECDVCDNDPANDCVQDCNDLWGGTALLDECDVCEGDNTTCADCAGVPNGDAVEDECGVCNGNSTTCDSITVEPVADALVNAGSASTNFGLSEELRADRSVDESYLRFDLASNIPAGALIEAVNFKTTAHTGFAWGGDGNVYTYLVEDDTWAEEGITWNNRPAVSGTSLGNWWLWYDYSDTTVRTGEHATAEMVAAVQAELDSDGLISVRLHSPGYRTNYRSREYADASMRPRLEIQYLDCAGIPNGVAFVDSCGDCVGGTTELEAGDCSEPEEPEEPEVPDVGVGTGTTTLTKQGSCGGSDNTITCPAGYVAVGYQGQTGAWFDHVKLVCQALSADGTLGATSVTSANGWSNSGNNVGPYYCPAGNIMVGGQVRAGDHLDYVRGRCMSVADVAADSALGYTSSAYGMGNASGGSNYGDQLCPAGQAITGMIGGNAQYACRISWICSDITSN